MKIRLMGSPVMVRAWSQIFEEAFETKGRECRNRNSSKIRIYLELDDYTAGNAVRRVQGEGAPALESEKCLNNQEAVKHELARNGKRNSRRRRKAGSGVGVLEGRNAPPAPQG